MIRACEAAVLYICILGLSPCVEAASLKVSPAQFIVQNVEPGKLYDIYQETGLRLSIYNDDDVSRTWTLSTHRPSARGAWEKGYAEIPDAHWSWFDKDEITVAPNSVGHAHLYLQIPKDDKYYNQHWVVTLGIGGASGGGVALALDVRMQVETAGKTDLTSRPDGPLGFVPSTVCYENIAPGSNARAQFVLCNNDGIDHTYIISSLFEQSQAQRSSYLSHSYGAIPVSGWLKREKTIRVAAGESAVVCMELNVPDDAANFGKKWEDILLIQPNDGPAGFVRVQVQTAKRADTG